MLKLQGNKNIHHNFPQKNFRYILKRQADTSTFEKKGKENMLWQQSMIPFFYDYFEFIKYKTYSNFYETNKY